MPAGSQSDSTNATKESSAASSGSGCSLDNHRYHAKLDQLLAAGWALEIGCWQSGALQEEGAYQNIASCRLIAMEPKSQLNLWMHPITNGGSICRPV